jgi:DNA-binding MarR family transcriptional regulator
MCEQGRFLKAVVVWLNGLRADRDSTAFLVAYEIGRQTDRTLWEAWPTVRSIAKNLKLSEKTVHAAIGRLEQRGHLEVMHKPGRATRYSMIKRANNTETPRRPDAGR